MKKSFAILLLISLIAPFPGTYIILQYNKNKVKHEIAGMISNGIDKKDLILLKFTRKETETRLNWKHPGEFEYNGEMYDIVEKHQEGDTIFYNCYKDHKETRLVNEIERLVTRAMGQYPGQRSQTDKIVDFFKTAYRQDVFTWKPLSPQATIFNFSFFIIHYSSFAITPPSPPPKAG